MYKTQRFKCLKLKNKQPGSEHHITAILYGGLRDLPGIVALFPGDLAGH